MGFYLNPDNKGFWKAVRSKIYVDKTGLIACTNELINTEQQYLCVSRPRRFGKSMALKMLAAYYSRGCDSAALFQGLKIENADTFQEHLNQYDVIFLGYPIWHGQAPRIISTFLERYDLTGKTIVPFCISGSSPIGSSARNLQSLASGAAWLEGQRFSGSASRDTVASWVNGLALSQQSETNPQEESDMLNITVNGTTLTATLADNSSAQALRELLAAGPRTIQMSDYDNMEKVGPLGQSLPTNNEQINTQAGDIILYQGNQIVIYYDTNSWNFTRLGKINGVTAQGLRNILGSGDVSVVLSLG